MSKLRALPLVVLAVVFGLSAITWWSLRAVPMQPAVGPEHAGVRPTPARSASLAELGIADDSARAAAAEVVTAAPAALAPSVPLRFGSIAGTCRTRDGVPNENWLGFATLTSVRGECASALLGPKGRFRFDVVAPGTYVVRVEARTCDPVEQRVDVDAAERQLEFTLDPQVPWTLDVDVFDPQAIPFAHAISGADARSAARRELDSCLRVVATRECWRVGDGASGRPGRLPCRVSPIADPAAPAHRWRLDGELGARGCLAVVLGDRVVASEPYVRGARVQLMLDPVVLDLARQDVHVAVRDGVTGTPLDAVEVKWTGALGLGRVSVTDSRGNAHLEGAVAGPAMLRLSKIGWFARPREVEAHAGALVDLGVVDMYPYRRLSGRVVGALGEGGSVLYVRGTEGPGREDWEQEEVGRVMWGAVRKFEIDSLEPAVYFVCATEPAYVTAKSVEQIRSGQVPGWIRIDVRSQDATSIELPFTSAPLPPAEPPWLENEGRAKIVTPDEDRTPRGSRSTRDRR